MHFLKDYQPFPYAITGVDIAVDFMPGSTRIVSKLCIERAKDAKAGVPLELNGEELELLAIKIDGAPLASDRYTHENNLLVIKEPPAGRFTLETEVALKPEENTQLMGLYRSNGVWCTQCEAEGFRRITFMADRPDVMATYRVRLTADKELAPVLLANGNPVESGDLAGGRHYAIWEDPHPKPAYLFAMVAGELDALRDEFTTMSGKRIALAIYCEPGKAGRCTYAMGALKRSMAWDEKRFGREYDLDVFNVVAVSDFNFGAMENKGLNIFNDKYILANPETATDTDYYSIERIVAHEYFHNWTGNRITCRDWFQLCLKEGLTVYRDQEFTSDMRSRAVKRIGDARDLRAGQFPEDAGPLAHPPRPDKYAEINNFYTATVYNKGAEVVRMLATLLGEEEFRKGCDLYFERHDGEAVTIESWLKVFEDSSGRDLGQFALWYTQAGTPEVTYRGEWHEADKTYHLHLSQSTGETPGQPDKKPLPIPLKFGLVGANGKDMDWETVSGGEVEGRMIVLDTPNRVLKFEGLPAKPVLSLLREFSAPVILFGDQGTKEQFFLARHDADPFNRWQALQSVATTMMAEAVHSDDQMAPDDVDRLAAALGETLENQQDDHAFRALALGLPGEGAIARELGENVNPAKIHTVRRNLLKSISTRLSARLLAAYETLESTAPPNQDMAQVRARALRNQCLNLLVADGSAQNTGLARAQYFSASNLSDRMAALGACVGAWSPTGKEMLTHFGDNFTKDPLLYDKWLALNAMRPDEGALTGVKTLFEDPSFPKTNPNRLRALMGTFTMGNPGQFTRPDGKGFEYVASFCAQIDADSPQVAARILTAFRQWRTLEPIRKGLAEKVLQSLSQSGQLSPDSADILQRMLNG